LQDFFLCAGQGISISHDVLSFDDDNS